MVFIVMLIKYKHKKRFAITDFTKKVGINLNEVPYTKQKVYAIFLNIANENIFLKPMNSN